MRPRTIWASLSPTKASTARRPGAMSVVSQTWLAQPCTLLASVRAASGKRRQHAAELDEIAIAIVPLVKQGEILVDLVDRHDGSAACIGNL